MTEEIKDLNKENLELEERIIELLNEKNPQERDFIATKFIYIPKNIVSLYQIIKTKLGDLSIDWITEDNEAEALKIIQAKLKILEGQNWKGKLSTNAREAEADTASLAKTAIEAYKNMKGDPTLTPIFEKLITLTSQLKRAIDKKDHFLIASILKKIDTENKKLEDKIGSDPIASLRNLGEAITKKHQKQAALPQRKLKSQTEVFWTNLSPKQQQNLLKDLASGDTSVENALKEINPKQPEGTGWITKDNAKGIGELLVSKLWETEGDMKKFLEVLTPENKSRFSLELLSGINLNNSPYKMLQQAFTKIGWPWELPEWLTKENENVIYDIVKQFIKIVNTGNSENLPKLGDKDTPSKMSREKMRGKNVPAPRTLPLSKWVSKSVEKAEDKYHARIVAETRAWVAQSLKSATRALTMIKTGDPKAAATACEYAAEAAEAAKAAQEEAEEAKAEAGTAPAREQAEKVIQEAEKAMALATAISKAAEVFAREAQKAMADATENSEIEKNSDSGRSSEVTEENKESYAVVDPTVIDMIALRSVEDLQETQEAIIRQRGATEEAMRTSSEPKIPSKICNTEELQAALKAVEYFISDEDLITYRTILATAARAEATRRTAKAEYDNANWVAKNAIFDHYCRLLRKSDNHYEDISEIYDDDDLKLKIYNIMTDTTHDTSDSNILSHYYTSLDSAIKEEKTNLIAEIKEIIEEKTTDLSNPDPGKIDMERIIKKTMKDTYGIAPTAEDQKLTTALTNMKEAIAAFKEGSSKDLSATIDALADCYAERSYLRPARQFNSLLLQQIALYDPKEAARLRKNNATKAASTAMDEAQEEQPVVPERLGRSPHSEPQQQSVDLRRMTITSNATKGDDTSATQGDKNDNSDKQNIDNSLSKYIQECGSYNDEKPKSIIKKSRKPNSKINSRKNMR